MYVSPMDTSMSPTDLSVSSRETDISLPERSGAGADLSLSAADSDVAVVDLGWAEVDWSGARAGRALSRKTLGRRHRIGIAAAVVRASPQRKLAPAVAASLQGSDFSYSHSMVAGGLLLMS
jgi:hypothetical protein